MKVLFIASRNQESLMIEREITLLQQRGWPQQAKM